MDALSRPQWFWHVSTATDFPLKWTADDYNWQIDLPIMGSSSPVLWGKRLYLMGDHADGQQRSVLCVNADSGRILWRRDYPVKRHRLHRDNDFTSATPCVDEHGVILAWSSPEQLQVTALSFGWRENVAEGTGSLTRDCTGSSNSPILAEGLVVLANDQMDPKRFAWYLPKGTNMDPGKSFLDRARPQDGQDAMESGPKIGAGGLCDALYPPFGRA